MTSRAKKPKLTCPCCRNGLYDSSVTMTIGRRVWLWGKTRVLERGNLIDGRFQWACDECLSSGRAIVANPEAQLYCDYDPYLTYFDIDKVCEKCGNEYVFRKEEQKYWYESLKFWVQSKPRHCPTCRKEVREDKKLNRELSDLLKDKEKLTVNDMTRLSQIYSEIKKPEKAKYYQKLAKKVK